MKASGTICIPNLHCYKSLLSSAESSTSVVLVACQEAVGNIVVYQFGKKTPIGLFKFPSKVTKPQKHQSWVKTISMYRRRGGGDTFDSSSKNEVI